MISWMKLWIDFWWYGVVWKSEKRADDGCYMLLWSGQTQTIVEDAGGAMRDM